jgi:hypothetical protein
VKNLGCSYHKAEFPLADSSMASSQQHVAVLALATLGGARDIGSFLLFCITQGGQVKYSHVSLSLALSPTNVDNVKPTFCEKMQKSWLF